MDSDETPDWELRNEVEDWLLQTRLTPDRIWESDLAPDDLSQVEAEQTDFTEPGPRRVLEALIAKRLLPKNKLETVLRLVAYKHDLKRIALIEYRRGGGSGATRRARARHRNRGG